MSESNVEQIDPREKTSYRVSLYKVMPDGTIGQRDMFVSYDGREVFYEQDHPGATPLIKELESAHQAGRFALTQIPDAGGYIIFEAKPVAHVTRKEGSN
jgi:hypothetical protein